MQRLNQAGREAIEEFIAINHKDALYTVDYLADWYKQIEDADPPPASLLIKYSSLATNGRNKLRISPEWFE